MLVNSRHNVCFVLFPAVCIDPCGSRAKCVSPGKCECIHPYTGKNCAEKKNKHQCKSECLNGGRCRHGKCKCPPTHYGSSCQHCKYCKYCDCLSVCPQHRVCCHLCCQLTLTCCRLALLWSKLLYKHSGYNSLKIETS